MSHNQTVTPFQIRGPVTAKRRSPSKVTVQGTLSKSMLEEQ